MCNKYYLLAFLAINFISMGNATKCYFCADVDILESSIRNEDCVDDVSKVALVNCDNLSYNEYLNGDMGVPWGIFNNSVNNAEQATLRAFDDIVPQCITIQLSINLSQQTLRSCIKQSLDSFDPCKYLEELPISGVTITECNVKLCNTDACNGSNTILPTITSLLLVLLATYFASSLYYIG